MSGWQPMETAPKGGGAEMVTDPAWVDPPRVLLLFNAGQQAVCHWDWYYAPEGNGYSGVDAWVEPISGQLACIEYGEPKAWQPLPQERCEPVAWMSQADADAFRDSGSTEAATVYSVQPGLGDWVPLHRGKA